MPEPILLADRFTYCYPEARGPALRNVTLRLEPGSFTVVAGPSGGGKSTLLRAAAGLVPHFHGGDVAGRLAVGGLSVREHGPNELATVVGTVFQDPEAQVVMGGVRAELALPVEHQGRSPAAVARAVEETALALGIGHLLERRTDTLSGGELQRVALAAALVTRPALLVLDEPTSQLDPVAGDELVALLRRLNEEWGTAVLLAEHRLERCLPAADRVLVLHAGELVADASPGPFLRWATDGAGASLGIAPPLARLFALAGLPERPASVKAARAVLPVEVPEPVAESSAPPAGARGLRSRLRRPEPAALVFRDAWHELEDGPVVLRGIDLRISPGERVALLGRNGAGKSTLLRHARGLIEPTRGRVERAGPVALLLQSPGDFLIHEHAVDEAGPAALAAAGLVGREGAHPRDLSGGERERLSLEVALAGGPHAVVALDEPTRGMDTLSKRALARRIRELASGGAAVVVATHDTEFAATFAERVVLMGQGVVVADAGAAAVLGGGWHFATEVARALRGAGGALTPEEGAAILTASPAPGQPVAAGLAR